MRPGRRRSAAGRARPRRTVRLRLTLWYSGLFLASGAALLVITYGLVVQAFTADADHNVAACRVPGRRCHSVSAQVARSIALRDHSALLGDLLTRSALALAVMTVLSVALGWFVASRALRPLRTMTATTARISAASLGERLDLSGPDDELKELGDTIDRLLDRLEASFLAQRQFVANAAHEMRTPLARQRIISQVAVDDPDAGVESLRAAHDRVLAAGSELQHLMDALLTLARGQAGLDRREHLDLADVAGRVVSSRRAEADERGLDLHDALAPSPTAGSPHLAERLVANLVDNALRYNVPGGRVEVSTGVAGHRAVLSVSNTGPQIPAAALDRLFQPFQRMIPERTSRGDGMGLGLSIVQAIAEAHGASVTASPRPGGGLVVEVAFPETAPITALGEIATPAPATA